MAAPASRGRDGRRTRRFHAAPLANLLAPHRVVQALQRDQLVVASGLDDAAALEHVNPIGVQDRRQAVGDEDGNRLAARGDGADRVDDAFFGERVERGRRLVEDQQMRAGAAAPGRSTAAAFRRRRP